MQGAHALLAMRLDQPHWLLNDADAKTYGAAIANAMRHLPIGATQKAVDFSALFICAINVETPRVYASTRIAKARRQAREQPPTPSAVVYPFPSAAPQQSQSPPPGAAAPATPANGSGVAVEGFTDDGIDAPPIGGHH